MDRLTHISITNCAKELDALSKLVISEQFTYQEISDWIEEISWNLSRVFKRSRYNSDEFQHRLKKLLKESKRQEAAKPQHKDPREDCLNDE